MSTFNKDAPVLITSANEDTFVTTKNCTKCPDDSGCYKNTTHSSGQPFCFCYHFTPPTPLPKGTRCPRKVSQVFPTDNIEDHRNHRGIPVHLDHEPVAGVPKISEPRHTAVAINITIATIVFSSMILMAFFVCFIKRGKFNKLLSKRSKQKVEMLDLAPGSSVLLLPSDRFVMNPTYESATSCVDLSIRVFCPEELKLSSQIGQGCFGKVFKGDLVGQEVAVKMVKKEHSGEAMKEVETMSTFSHPNILHLIGIVQSTHTEVPWLVFEYMKYGDLASVLRNNARRITNQGESRVGQVDNVAEEDYLFLTSESLIDMASQVAEGMKYLAEQHFVHRDLAARNCLVSSSGGIKISDFGLSRDVYTCDYYKIGGSRLLPLRWMAPESILYGRFTLESDVWAYGVLLWEIFTWGKQPYYGHSNDEVVQLILDGVLLCPPSDCPTSICKIMESCWKTEAKDRVKFQQVIQMLGSKDPYKGNDGPLSGEERVTIPEQSKPCMTIQTWLESGYEIPRNILQTDYLKVV